MSTIPTLVGLYRTCRASSVTVCPRTLDDRTMNVKRPSAFVVVPIPNSRIRTEAFWTGKPPADTWPDRLRLLRASSGREAVRRRRECQHQSEGTPTADEPHEVSYWSGGSKAGPDDVGAGRHTV